MATEEDVAAAVDVEVEAITEIPGRFISKPQPNSHSQQHANQFRYSIWVFKWVSKCKSQ